MKEKTVEVIRQVLHSSYDIHTLLRAGAASRCYAVVVSIVLPPSLPTSLPT